MGYLVEGLELLICKVAYTKYDATWLVSWSNYKQIDLGAGILQVLQFPLPILIPPSALESL
jgi:hypothetical protein